jgi:hypothetical protein
VVVDALVATLPRIGDVLLITSLVYLLFGILGLNLFMGKMWYCAVRVAPRAMHTAPLLLEVWRYCAVRVAPRVHMAPLLWKSARTGFSP